MTQVNVFRSLQLTVLCGLFRRCCVGIFCKGFNATVLPFLIGTIYWQLGNSQGSISDRMGAMTFVLLMQASFLDCCRDLTLLVLAQGFMW